MANDVQKSGGGGLRAADGLALVVVGVVGVVVAFWLLSAVAGFLWGLVKLVVVVAVLYAVLRFLLNRHKA